MKSFTKLIAIAVIFTVLLIVPKTANALFGAGDTVILTNPDLIVSINATAVNTGVTAGTVQAEFVEMTWKWAWEVAQEILKKQLLDMMVDQIVRWIQGGGDPKFITNFPAFFRDAIDQAGGKFLQTAIGPQILLPFQP